MMKKVAAKVAEDKVILKDAMMTRGATQVQIAEKLGIKQSSVSTNLSRDRMGLDTFKKILNVLGYDVAVIDRESGRVYWVVEPCDEK